MKVLAHLLKIKYLGQIPTKTIVGGNMDYIPPCFQSPKQATLASARNMMCIDQKATNWLPHN